MTFVQIALFDWLPGRRKVYIFKKYYKIFFSETISRMKLTRGIHANDITLYITLYKSMFLLSVSECFRCCGNLKFP